VLASRRVRGRAQVDDGRLVADGGEGMPKSLREEHRAPARVIQGHGLPAPVRGRADPDIDDHVEHRAADACDVFRLSGRNAGEVDAPHDSAAGDGAVGLRDIRPVPERLEFRGPEPFQEVTPVIPVHGGRERPGTADARRLHISLLTSRPFNRWTISSISGQPEASGQRGGQARAMLHFGREEPRRRSVAERKVTGSPLRGQTK
jgi:hypothetical protein